MGSTDAETKLAYTVAEALKRVPLGRTAFYEAIKRKQIPAVRVGARLLIPRGALEKMFADAVSSATEPDARTAA